MKKLLGIVVLGLLISNKALATMFECEMNNPSFSDRIYKYIIEINDENNNEVLLINPKENKILVRYSNKSKATITIIDGDGKYKYDGFTIRNHRDEKQFIFIEDRFRAHSVYVYLLEKDRDNKLYNAKSIDSALDDFSSGICRQLF